MIIREHHLRWWNHGNPLCATKCIIIKNTNKIISKAALVTMFMPLSTIKSLSLFERLFLSLLFLGALVRRCFVRVLHATWWKKKFHTRNRNLLFYDNFTINCSFFFLCVWDANKIHYHLNGANLMAFIGVIVNLCPGLIGTSSHILFNFFF